MGNRITSGSCIFLITFVIINPDTMRRLDFTGNWKSPTVDIEVETSIFSFKEDNNHIIYSPHFDISGYGRNQKAALESFKTSLSEFLAYTINKKTFFFELRKLGWKIKKSNKKPLESPTLADMVKKHKYLAEIMKSRKFYHYPQILNIPVPSIAA